MSQALPIATRAVLTADDFTHFDEAIETAEEVRTLECATARFVCDLALLGFDPAHVRASIESVKGVLNDSGDRLGRTHQGQVAITVAYTFGEGADRLRFSNTMPFGECEFPSFVGVQIGEGDEEPRDMGNLYSLGYEIASAWGEGKGTPPAPSESARAAERWTYENAPTTVVKRAAFARRMTDAMNDEVWDACARYELAKASAQLAQWAVTHLGYTRAQIEGRVEGDASDALEDDRYSVAFVAPDDERLMFHAYLSKEEGDTVTDIEESATVAVHIEDFRYGPCRVETLAQLGGIIEDAESAHAERTANAGKKPRRGGKQSPVSASEIVAGGAK